MDKDVLEELQKIWKKLRELEFKANTENIDVEKQEVKSNLEENIKLFCKNNQINEGSLKYEIDFQEDLPRMINLPKENVRTKLQFNTLIALSFIIYRVYDKKLSEELVRNLLDLNKIPVDRMDKLYSSPDFKKFYSKSGQNIKISWAGEKESIKIIKELVSKNETNTSR